MTKRKNEIFDKVVFIGPDRKGKGGIASVLKLYSESIDVFHYLPTNSSSGHLKGLMNAAVSLLRLPIERLKGRKIAHIHYAGRKSWSRKLVFLRFARMLGYKTIMHCHCELNVLAGKKGEGNVTRNLGKADANVVLANNFKIFGETNLGLNNVKILNNPCRVTDTKIKDVTPGSPISFLFIGILNNDKGCFDIIEAARRLKEQDKTFHIVMAGSGPEDEELKALVKAYGLESQITFPGWIKDKEKVSRFEQAHVLVLPSYSEGMPVSILEAKNYGLSVIGSNVGAIPDIVRHGVDGFVIRPGDVDALAAKMLLYIEAPSMLRSHCLASREHVNEFAADKVAGHLKNLYTSIL